jgi:long-subunit acyl-CoA synthetase (AMP-forming)
MTGTLQLSTAAAEALSQPTLPAAFQIVARRDPDAVALETYGGEQSVTWREFAARVEAVAGGLHALGVGRDQTVAILLRNIPTFNIVDAAALHLGAVPFSLYATEPVEQMIALVADSGAEVIITETSFLDKVRAVAAASSRLRHVVVDGSEPGKSPRELSLAELEASAPAGFDFEASWRRLDEEATATLVYTSGTTGAPKGVQISHRAVMNSLRGVDHHVATEPHRGVSFLPAAHITDRFICHYSTLGLGGRLVCVPDHEDLWDAILATRPTRFFGVPRTCEKLAERARAIIGADPLLDEALVVGYERARAEQSGTVLAPDRAAAAAAADAALAPVREQLGLDQVQWFAVAAAPTAYEVLEFHHAVGLRLAELWGMTECMMSTMNPPGRIKLGTVGIPLPTVEVRIAEDGELLLRGGHACSGYRGDPERTAEMLDGERWVHSGDLADVDEDGYLRIIGRKKEQMINSSGKNLFPVKIESAVLQASPLIAHVAAIGDRRRFVTALVVLDPDELAALAARAGLNAERVELLRAEPVRAEVERAVAAGNERLSRVEQIRGWTILDAEWLPGGEEVTNTLKLRRGRIDEKYAEQIEALYA